MKPQYHEGNEALERFEKGTTKLFQAPVKQKPKPVRKPKKSSKD